MACHSLACRSPRGQAPAGRSQRPGEDGGRFQRGGVPILPEGGLRGTTRSDDSQVFGASRNFPCYRPWKYGEGDRSLFIRVIAVAGIGDNHLSLNLSKARCCYVVVMGKEVFLSLSLS